MPRAIKLNHSESRRLYDSCQLWNVGPGRISFQRPQSSSTELLSTQCCWKRTRANPYLIFVGLYPVIRCLSIKLFWYGSFSPVVKILFGIHPLIPLSQCNIFNWSKHSFTEQLVAPMLCLRPKIFKLRFHMRGLHHYWGSLGRLEGDGLCEKCKGLPNTFNQLAFQPYHVAPLLHVSFA